MTTWKWVSHPEGGARLSDVGIRPDGTLHNPNGYDEAVVCQACERAEERLR